MTVARSRARFTVRRLMVAVVVAGVISAGLVMVLRVAERRERSRAHRHQSDVAKLAVREIESFRGQMAPKQAEADSAQLAREAEHHRRLAEKWESAAARPWSTVEPDPPGPR